MFTNLYFTYQDSDMGNGKLGNESYSGNDDGSDDNQHGSNNDDLNVSYTLSLSLFAPSLHLLSNLYHCLSSSHIGKSRLVALKEIEKRERSAHGTTTRRQQHFR